MNLGQFSGAELWALFVDLLAKEGIIAIRQNGFLCCGASLGLLILRKRQFSCVELLWMCKVDALDGSSV